MELLTGREPIGPEFKDVEGGNLVGWVKHLVKLGRASDALDSVASDGAWKGDMVKLLHLACLCTSDDPSMRPAMHIILKFFKEVVVLDTSPHPI